MTARKAFVLAILFMAGGIAFPKAVYSQPVTIPPPPKAISIESLGYDDILLNGINPRYSFTIPAFADAQGEMILNLKFSPIIRNDSTYTVSVDDIPVKVDKIDESGYNPRVVVPVTVKKKDKFIKISVSGNLRVTEDICEDTRNENIWMLIEKSSGLSLLRTPGQPPTVSDFFLNYENKYYLVDTAALTPDFLSLAYEVNKVKLQKTETLFADSPKGPLNIVPVDEGATGEDARVDAGNLYLTRAGLDFVKSELLPLGLTKEPLIKPFRETI